jgi:hypothetical protein
VKQGVMWFSLLVWSVTAFAQTVTPPSKEAVKEAYRLRVENVQFGRVELSADAGKTYHLVGRVLNSAVTVFPFKDAKTAGTVLKSGKEGIVFAAASGMTLKLRPQAAPTGTKAGSMTEPGAIFLNLKAGEGIFGDWIPSTEASVRLQTRLSSLTPFPSVYAPSDSDVFVFVVPPKEGQNVGELKTKMEALSSEYKAKAVLRAKAEKRTVVNGTLTLRAKLPPGEPDPIAAVTYLIDGELAAIQNAAPYLYAWDTRRVPDGEYSIEIRGMNKQGNLVTKIRALVAVDNGKK